MIGGGKLLLVLVAGGVGTSVRYLLSNWIYSAVERPIFPYANFVINVSGCLAVGFLAVALEQRFLVSPATRVAILTGFLGGYTTFSSFAFETVTLIRDRELWLAGVNVVGSLGLGLLAVILGMKLAETVL